MGEGFTNKLVFCRQIQFLNSGHYCTSCSLKESEDVCLLINMGWKEIHSIELDGAGGREKLYRGT